MVMSDAAMPMVGGEASTDIGSNSNGVPRGLRISRIFSRKGERPLDQVEWVIREATISNESGQVVFSQRDVEVPRGWSQMATNVVASKYFRGIPGTPNRERSARQLIERVVGPITEWGYEDGYFASEESREAFRDELSYLLSHQYSSFNSPVWFNVGIDKHPQCSACFINSIEDRMESILGLAMTEGMLFKFGSGTGTNLSPLRGSHELLSEGGTASGPVSFMRGFDSFAGVIKSGGKTRRAAKMVILNADHPDIIDFIQAKEREEKKAWALIEAGYDGSFNGEAYSSVFFQNSNNSVRVTDDFMRAVENDGVWATRARTTGEVVERHRARDLLTMIAQAAHVCGDPGLQFDTTINMWHTCPADGRINASNPCSEYMFLDDSACNLSSLNLLRFQLPDGRFDITQFCHAVRIMLLAQEILVDRASYPTEKIAANSTKFRSLGLGYANLGALLLAQGLPYDSEEGRKFAGAVTALLTGTAYHVSAEIAAAKGPFAGFPDNREAMLGVISNHQSHLMTNGHSRSVRIWEAARAEWAAAVELGASFGFRNAQVTVLAPTGTIGFMMDCDTTGIEPDIALVKYKKLVGGGQLKLVNHSVRESLKILGYSDEAQANILSYLETNDTIEGAPGLRHEHLPVFDCAFRPAKGTRSISPEGHLLMMAAVQPFLSGAISKTVNLARETTPKHIEETFLQAWHLGLKSVAVYRDGSKRTQPLSTRGGEESARKPYRRRLPIEREALTHKFTIGGHEGYVTVGMYEDRTPGEIFIVMSKEGSTISGLMDVYATAVSMALQYGVPLQVLIDKFIHTRFEPAGYTGNKDIPFAKSVADYIFRWMELKFLKHEDTSTSNMPEAPAPAPAALSQQSRAEIFRAQEDAPPCSECGSIMVRNGACYKCLNCGATSGCS